MTQRVRGSPHDRQAQTQAFAGRVDLVKGVEDGAELVRRNAGAGIQHLDGDRVAAAAAADQHAALRGVLDGVADEVADDGAQHAGVAHPAPRAVDQPVVPETAPAATRTAPVPPVESRVEPEKTVELSPFVVQSEQDTGYQATSTLAGTRLNWQQAGTF
eukprot:gene32926-44042_t